MASERACRSRSRGACAPGGGGGRGRGASSVAASVWLRRRRRPVRSGQLRPASPAAGRTAEPHAAVRARVRRGRHPVRSRTARVLRVGAAEPGVAGEQRCGERAVVRHRVPGDALLRYRGLVGGRDRQHRHGHFPRGRPRRHSRTAVAGAGDRKDAAADRAELDLRGDAVDAAARARSRAAGCFRRRGLPASRLPHRGVARSRGAGRAGLPAGALLHRPRPGRTDTGHARRGVARACRGDRTAPVAIARAARVRRVRSRVRHGPSADVDRVRSRLGHRPRPLLRACRRRWWTSMPSSRPGCRWPR